MRVVFAAVALCALSFVAGVAGDLSTASSSPPSRSGASVVLMLPPDVIRAGPLPPLATPTAVAEPVATPRRAEARALIPREKPRAVPIAYAVKDNPDRAPKDEQMAGRDAGADKGEA